MSFVSGWSAGQTKTIAGKQWYVKTTNAKATILFCKSSVGTGNWSTANSTANSWATSNKSSITGASYSFTVSSRLPDRIELGGISVGNQVASQYNLGITYWLSDKYGANQHYVVGELGNCGYSSDHATRNIVPLLTLSP